MRNCKLNSDDADQFLDACNVVDINTQTLPLEFDFNTAYPDRMSKVPNWIVLESESESADNRKLVFASALISIFRKRGVRNVGILLSKGKLKECVEMQDKTVLALCFSDLSHDTLSRGVRLGGRCEFTVSPYPSVGCEALVLLAQNAGLATAYSHKEEQSLKCAYNFFTLLDLEQKMLDFSRKCKDFDQENSTLSRIIVDKLTLPVQGNEDIIPYFSHIDDEPSPLAYDSYVGNVLDRNRGVYIRIAADERAYSRAFSYVIHFLTEVANG